MRLTYQIVVSIFFGLVLTFVFSGYTTVHPYVFGNECNDSDRLNGSMACYGVTEIHGFPLGYSPKIPGSIGSGYEDMNRLFYLENLFIDVLFFSLIFYVALDLIGKARGVRTCSCGSGKKFKKCHGA